MATHANAFQRLGAALTFNRIYREFREQTSLVDQFTLECIDICLASIRMSHADEQGIGKVPRLSTCFVPNASNFRGH